jgi:hypothetical protein
MQGASAPPPPPPGAAPPADPNAPAPGWDQADALAGAAAAPGGIPTPQPDITPYAGSAPPGALGATPTQATAEGLNVSARQQALDDKIAGVQAQGYDAAADTHAQAAAEKQQQAKDYEQFHAEARDRYEQAHRRILDAYDDYKKKAGSLKDPSSQYWEDKGTGARVLSGLASFSSALGAGLTGQGGNPYLDFLNKQIDRNYASHKQNISDMFDKQVAAGKIADTDTAWTRYQDEAKLHYYDLAQTHIQDTLKEHENRALGANVKNLAQKTNLDIEQQKIAQRAALSHAQAQAAAGAAASARAEALARQKRAEETFTKLYDNQPKDVSDEERVQGAFRALSAVPGIRDEDLASTSRAVGATPDGKGGWTLPKPTGGGADIDPETGRRYAPAELAKHKAVQTKVDAITHQVSQFLNDPAVTDAGGMMRGAQGVLPSSMQSQGVQDQGAKLNEIGSLMTSAIGSVAKDADGKPNKVMIERYHEKFEPTLADPPHVRQQKIASGLAFYKDLARSEGAKIPDEAAPTPGAAPPAANPFAAFGGRALGK